jgi:hypothetical protein
MTSSYDKKYCIKRNINLSWKKQLPERLIQDSCKEINEKNTGKKAVKNLGNPCGFIIKSGHIPLSEKGKSSC